MITQRAEAKDYIDLLALIRSGISLSNAMGAARALYGEQFNPMMTLKSLTYFDDGDLQKLALEHKQQLLQIAANQEYSLPEVPRLSDDLSTPP